MQFKGFVGPTYQLDAVTADCQRCINLYPESIESGSGKSGARLTKRPGLLEFTDIGNYPVTAMIELIVGSSQTMYVSAANGVTGSLYQISSFGVATELTSGILTNATSMASNGTQIMLCCSGGGVSTLYCWDISAATLTDITATQLPGTRISRVVWHPDGYFIGLDPTDKKIYLSALNDGSSWDAIDSAQIFTTDIPIQIIVDHREVWIFGTKTTAIYVNTGNNDFPFEPIQGASIETGVIGNTAARADNSLFWLGRNESGKCIVYRANGYSPVRISTHAVEQFLEGGSYTESQISSANGFTIVMGGHTFYFVSIPSVNYPTFVYDASTGLWSEWANYAFDFTGFIGSGHVNCFGKHLISNHADGIIYELSKNHLDDNGYPIHWLRRAPHLANEGKRVFYHSLMLDVETGVGTVTETAPEMSMRYSNDGARTWSTPQTAALGASGAYSTRVRFNRLGSARDRVFEVSGSDAVSISITDAFLEVSGGDH